MATLKTTANRIELKMQDTRRTNTKGVLVTGIPLVLLASICFFPGIPFYLFIFAIAVGIARKSYNPIMAAGHTGEQRTLTVLSQLPDNFTIYNQVTLPDDRSRTGFCEADFVVVGPNGVFIVENKDYKAVVIGHADDHQWTLQKLGRGGTAYYSPTRNPVRQVRKYVAILGSLFKTRNIRSWITPLVALSRDNSLDNIHSNQVRVIQATDLASIIFAQRGTLSDADRVKVEALLDELRQTEEGKRKAA